MMRAILAFVVVVVVSSCTGRLPCITDVDCPNAVCSEGVCLAGDAAPSEGEGEGE